MSMSPIPVQWQRGFTLIEMAIVLLIVGLLLGSLLTPLKSKVEHQRFKESSAELDRVLDALMGYAVVNQRLPCSDTNGDGVEDNVGSASCSDEGTVPWVTLGAGHEDAWGRQIRYRVDIGFATAPIPDPANTVSAFIIEDLAGTALTPAAPDGPVAILFSCGGDGLPNDKNDANGAVNNRTCENPGNPDLVYVQDRPDPNYDDILVWLSKNRLLNQMVAAGKWP